MKSLTKIYFKLIGQLEERESNHLFSIFDDIHAEGKTTSEIDNFNLAVKLLEHPDSINHKPH